MFGRRSLCHDGWRAVCPWPGLTQSGRRFGARMSYSELIQLDAHGWELYNLDDDPGQTNDLADRERDRLITMIGMWYVEAGKHDVLPVDTRSTARFAMQRPRMSVPRRPSGTVSPRAMARR
jgi:arylsulfatase